MAGNPRLTQLRSFTANVIPYGNASKQVNEAAMGTAGQCLAFNATPAPYAVDLPPYHNFILNGDWHRAVRQVPATLTTLTAEKYSADRWRVSVENASLQYQRSENTTDEAGITSRYYGTYKKITNTGKFAVYQPFSHTDTWLLKGDTIVFQTKLKASGNKTIKIGLNANNSPGATADAIDNPYVPTWNADTVDPTFGANTMIDAAPKSCAITTAWSEHYQTGTVGYTAQLKNLIPTFWTNSQFAAGDTLSIAETALYRNGSLVEKWYPRDTYIEDNVLDKYCFGITAAKFQSMPGARVGTTVIHAHCFPPSMRATPILGHNISAWTGGAPGTTTVAAYNYIAGGYATITGALTVGSAAISPNYHAFVFTAGTSFSGTSNDYVGLFLGPDVIAYLDSELL